MLANEYLAWFAMECHFTPDQVFDMPFVSLVRLSLLADDVADQRKSQAQQADTQRRSMRRMA